MEIGNRETLGDFLKQERESRVVSAPAVAKVLKVDPSWISFLEANEFQLFPNPKDIPDLLRRYAKFLLIDEAELIRRFDTECQTLGFNKEGSVSVKPLADVSIQKPFLIRPRTAKKRLWIGAFATVFFVVLLMIVGMYAFFYREPVKILKKDLALVEKKAESYINPQTPAPQPQKIIGNRDSKRYHLPGMRYYDTVDIHHRVEFSTEQEAIAAGYHKAPR